jgi:hypothetical protein
MSDGKTTDEMKNDFERGGRGTLHDIFLDPLRNIVKSLRMPGVLI